jgi:hypothetical protein
MIPVKQKYLHIPDEQAGDCWRACLASILECDIELFPAPNIIDDWSDYYPKIFQVLHSLGYLWIGYTIENTDRTSLLAPDTDGYIIAVGKSPRSTIEKRVNHSVVWKNGIIHDPHPDNKGILDIIAFEILLKIK